MPTFIKHPGPFLRPLYKSIPARRKVPPQRLRRQARIIGIVLAGGHSKRMGQDKATLPLAGEHKDLLARTVSLLQDVCGRAIVVGRETPEYACLPDIEPDCGPVGGVATALDYCQSAACLVLSCDMPFMRQDILERLIEYRSRREAGMHVTAYRNLGTGKVETMAAIYEPECLPYFQICANERLLKINRVVPPYHYHLLDYGDKEAQAFFNLNSSMDYTMARDVMRMVD